MLSSALDYATNASLLFAISAGVFQDLDLDAISRERSTDEVRGNVYHRAIITLHRRVPLDLLAKYSEYCRHIVQNGKERHCMINCLQNKSRISAMTPETALVPVKTYVSFETEGDDIRRQNLYILSGILGFIWIFFHFLAVFFFGLVLESALLVGIFL